MEDLLLLEGSDTSEERFLLRTLDAAVRVVLAGVAMIAHKTSACELIFLVPIGNTRMRGNHGDYQSSLLSARVVFLGFLELYDVLIFLGLHRKCQHVCEQMQLTPNLQLRTQIGQEAKQPVGRCRVVRFRTTLRSKLCGIHGDCHRNLGPNLCNDRETQRGLEAGLHVRGLFQ